MTELRQRMIDDMQGRRMAEKTQEAYLWAVTGLARYYRRSPDQITEPEVQAYLLYLIRDRGRAWSTCNIVVNGLRFFYHVTLKRDQPTFSIPGARTPMMRWAPRLSAKRCDRGGGGAYAEVLDDGEVAVGDEVGWAT